MLFQEIYLAIKEMQNFCVFVCVCVCMLQGLLLVQKLYYSNYYLFFL